MGEGRGKEKDDRFNCPPKGVYPVVVVPLPTSCAAPGLAAEGEGEEEAPPGDHEGGGGGGSGGAGEPKEPAGGGGKEPIIPVPCPGNILEAGGGGGNDGG